MLPVFALVLLASSLATPASQEMPVHEPGVSHAEVLQIASPTVAADSVFYLVSGSLPCGAFEPIMESLVRRPEVREFVGSNCTEGQVDMVVEFEFASESELMRWQVRKETRTLLAPVFRDLHPLRLQIRATPRDPSATTCKRRCGQGADSSNG
ncbi:MAG: hypothetical protein Rubg2KO_20920 [Rubricoccaceae bacterium]